MVSDPRVQIAFALLRQQNSWLPEPERRAAAAGLARLIRPGDVCESCWRLYANGTRGQSRHEPERCALERE